MADLRVDSGLEHLHPPQVVRQVAFVCRLVSTHTAERLLSRVATDVNGDLGEAWSCPCWSNRAFDADESAEA